jgi:hypothetical protein
MVMSEIRPPFEEYGDLEITLGRSKQTIWQVLAEFARDRSIGFVVGVVALLVCGTASAVVSNAWAAVSIIAMVLVFSVFVILHGKEKHNSHELGDESPSPQKARKD